MGIENYLYRPKEKEDFTQSPDSSWSVGQKTPSDVEDPTQKSMAQAKDAAAIKTEDSNVSEPSDDDILSTLLDTNYKKSENDIKRQRASEFWGNLANLAGQTFAASQGARQFEPLKDNTAAYNDQLSRLRQNYNSARVNLHLSEMQKKLAQRRWEAEFDEKQRQNVIRNNQWGASYQQNQDKIDADKEYKRGTLGLGTKRLENEKEKTTAAIAHNKAMEDVAKQNAASSRISANAAQQNASREKKTNESTIVVNDNGNLIPISYNKAKRGGLISLYNRMKALSTKHPGRYGSQLDDINMQFGEGGDAQSKVMTIIERRLQDFPELTGEFYNIIGHSNSGGGSLLPGARKPNKGGSLLP